MSSNKKTNNKNKIALNETSQSEQRVNTKTGLKFDTMNDEITVNNHHSEKELGWTEVKNVKKIKAEVRKAKKN